MQYKISRQLFDFYAENQRSAVMSPFKFTVANQGSFKVSHKGYKINNVRVEESTNICAISVFSGAGGLDIGAQLAGVKVLSSLDLFGDSVETLRLNKCFSETVHEKADIHDIRGDYYSSILRKAKPDKLIVLGGPPCQPFSKAGYWVTNEKRDSENDPRNLITPYFNLLAELKPDGFLLENVESILHPSNRVALESIHENMNRLGYQYTMLRVNAADYGIPQLRKRVFFLASRKKIDARLLRTHGSEKDCEADPSLRPYERVVDWIGKFDTEKYFLGQKLDIEGKWEEALKCVPMGRNYIALSARAGYPKPLFVAGKRYWTSLLKLHPFLPSWTIIASPGHWEGPFHWNNRRLCVRELAAIQTFPDDYMFYGSQHSIHKQIGNAVPPMLAKIVVEELCKWL